MESTGDLEFRCHECMTSWQGAGSRQQALEKWLTVHTLVFKEEAERDWE